MLVPSFPAMRAARPPRHPGRRGQLGASDELCASRCSAVAWLMGDGDEASSPSSRNFLRLDALPWGLAVLGPFSARVDL